MDLVTSWQDQSRRALGAGALAPAGVLAAAAAATLIAGGGLGGLGTLGQLFSGPPLPGGVAAAAGARTAGGDAGGGDALAVADVLPLSAALGAVTGGGTSPRRSAGSPGRQRSGPPASLNPPRRRPPTPAPPRPGPGPDDGGGPSPPRPPGPVRQVGDTVKGVTNQLPAPVAPVAEQVVEDLVETAEGLVPPSR